jgi:hypothetical protein
MDPKIVGKCYCGADLAPGSRACRVCRAADRKAARRSRRRATTCRHCGEAVPPSSEGVCGRCRTSPVSSEVVSWALRPTTSSNRQKRRKCPECNINEISGRTEICRLCENRPRWWERP